MNDQANAVRDALTQAAMDVREHHYRCGHCGCRYHEDSVAELRRTNGGGCIGCGRSDALRSEGPDAGAAASAARSRADHRASRPAGAAHASRPAAARAGAPATVASVTGLPLALISLAIGCVVLLGTLIRAAITVFEAASAASETGAHTAPRRPRNRVPDAFVPTTPAVLAPASPPGPPPSIEIEGLCPFECCTHRHWVAKETVEVHTDRSAESPLSFTLQRGEWAHAETGIVIAKKPAAVALTSAATFECRDAAGAVHTAATQPGDVLYLLAPRGEGRYVGWFKGQVLDDVAAGDLGNRSGAPADDPVLIDWWVKVVAANGIQGWTQATGSFAHKDACGDWLLTQPELERRLGVTRAEMEQLPSDDALPAWTQARDPEGVAWSYTPDGQFIALGSSGTVSPDQETVLENPTAPAAVPSPEVDGIPGRSGTRRIPDIEGRDLGRNPLILAGRALGARVLTRRLPPPTLWWTVPSRRPGYVSHHLHRKDRLVGYRSPSPKWLSPHRWPSSRGRKR